MKSIHRLLPAVALVLTTLAGIPTTSTGSDWLEFRGSDHQANANSVKLPSTWSKEKNLAWRVDLPAKGPSSPIVIGDKVVVCSSGGEGRQQDRIHINCFSTKTGEQLWHRQFWATGRPFSHPTSANAAPTPASDGERIYAFFSSNDLICLNLDGTLQWYRGLTYDYPKAANDVGMSSSPTVSGDVVCVQIENQGESFVAGLNKLTGETVWRQPRSQSAAWASPISFSQEGEDYFLLLGRTGVVAYRAKTGEIAWELDGAGSSVSSAVPVGEQLLLPFDGLTMVDPSKMDEGSPATTWHNQRLRPSNTSPVIDGDTAYLLGSDGVLTSCDLKTGERGWRVRIDGNYWSTPLVSNGYLYAFSQQGAAKIVRLGDDAEVVAELDTEETILASPAAGADGLFIRSDSGLWKFSVE